MTTSHAEWVILPLHDISMPRTHHLDNAIDKVRQAWHQETNGIKQPNKQRYKNRSAKHTPQAKKYPADEVHFVDFCAATMKIVK